MGDSFQHEETVSHVGTTHNFIRTNGQDPESGTGFLPDQEKNIYEIVDFCMAYLWPLEDRKHRSEHRNR